MEKENAGLWLPASIIAYNQQGEELYSRHYERDQKGNLIRYKFNITGESVSETQLFYDAQGKLLRSKTTYNTFGSDESGEDNISGLHEAETEYEVAVNKLSGKITEISLKTGDTITRENYKYRNDGSMHSEQFRITTDSGSSGIRETIATTHYYPTGLEASFSYVLTLETGMYRSSDWDMLYTYLWKYHINSRPKEVIVTRVREDETDIVRMKVKTDKEGNIVRLYVVNPDNVLTVSEVRIAYEKITQPSASAMILKPNLGNLLLLEPGMLR